MTRERPILFSAPMVRAILAGTKTQTRREVKPQPWLSCCIEDGMEGESPFVYSALYGDGPGHDVHESRTPCRCPYGQPGDRLRVKESAWMWCERRPNGTTKTGRQKWLYVPMRAAGIWYAADHRTKPNIRVTSPDTGNAWGWRLKIGRFLPALASRITLEITGVRVERLQEISEGDAYDEGTAEWCAETQRNGNKWPNIVRAYQGLWESINGRGSWDANPWVWVVEFRKLERKG